MTTPTPPQYNLGSEESHGGWPRDQPSSYFPGQIPKDVSKSRPDTCKHLSQSFESQASMDVLRQQICEPIPFSTTQLGPPPPFSHVIHDKKIKLLGLIVRISSAPAMVNRGAVSKSANRVRERPAGQRCTGEGLH